MLSSGGLFRDKGLFGKSANSNVNFNVKVLVRASWTDLREFKKELNKCMLRIRWTARSNESILKEINPKHSLERLMLKLKLQYFGHLIQGADLLEKTVMLRKIEGRKRRG